MELLEPPRRIDLTQETYAEGMSTVLKEILGILEGNDTAIVYVVAKAGN